MLDNAQVPVLECRARTPLTGISSSISDISKKLDERSRPQWTLMASAFGILITLVGVIGAAWKAPIRQDRRPPRMDLRHIEQSIVPRVEMEGLQAQTDRERDDIKSRLDRLEGWYFEGTAQ